MNDSIAHVFGADVNVKNVYANTLKWVHIAIGNAKRTLLGTFHKIKGKYLQNYLSEFCYKLNRTSYG